MLKAIEAVLDELGLREQLEPVRYCISISNGNTISVSAHVSHKSFFQIKLAESPSFEREYLAQLHAWQRYGAMVPKPLGRKMLNGWDVFVAQGVPHKPIIFDAQGKGRKFDEMLYDLDQFFRLSVNTTIAPESSPSLDLFLGRLEDYFNTSSISTLASKRIAESRHLGVCNMATIPQHGDFVLNNLAHCGNQPIVFDWEDYEKYFLPGFDLCTFCFSAASDVAELQSLMQSPRVPDTALGTVVRHACVALNIDPDLFRRLIPVYLLGFLHAKRNYSANVRSRITTVLTHMEHTYQ